MKSPDQPNRTDKSTKILLLAIALILIGYGVYFLLTKEPPGPPSQQMSKEPMCTVEKKYHYKDHEGNTRLYIPPEADGGCCRLMAVPCEE